MNLAACGAARQREDFVMRLGCFLVTFAVLASLVLLPPKAKAFAMTSSAVTALAGGFLSACGLTPVVSGMNNSGEVNESVARLIQDFLNEEVGGISVADWALSFGEIGLAVKDKRIVIPKPFAEKLGQFARWVAGKYGAKPGVNQVYREIGSYFSLADGSRYYISTFKGSGTSFTLVDQGTVFTVPVSSPVYLSTGYFLLSDAEGYLCYYNSAGELIGKLHFWRSMQQNGGYVSFGFSVPSVVNVEKYPLCFYSRPYNSSLSSWSYFSTLTESFVEKVLGLVLSSGESLSLDVAETLTIPEGLTEGQSIALDVGATQSMEIQEILQGILDAILAGNLSASAEIVDEAEVPVDPEEPDPPEVPVVPSGLDKLGAALTSRFPFSIPWDVYKGVTLLAAPPKAPYFEVDFMAPIADRVGGWKGSTKIVLDFSEYEIIGQVCRWTSTIGFCLMLASGTKRLIWTA